MIILCVNYSSINPLAPTALVNSSHQLAKCHDMNAASEKLDKTKRELDLAGRVDLVLVVRNHEKIKFLLLFEKYASSSKFSKFIFHRRNIFLFSIFFERSGYEGNVHFC